MKVIFKLTAFLDICILVASSSLWESLYATGGDIIYPTKQTQISTLSVIIWLESVLLSISMGQRIY